MTNINLLRTLVASNNKSILKELNRQLTELKTELAEYSDILQTVSVEVDWTMLQYIDELKTDIIKLERELEKVKKLPKKAGKKRG